MEVAKKQLRIATRNCGFIDPENIEDYLGVRGYEALANAITAGTPAGVIDEIKKCGIRGRGGGGFPTGTKWGFAAANQADQKYVTVRHRHGEALIEDSLKTLETELGRRAIRAHRNALVMAARIAGLEKTAAGNVALVFDNIPDRLEVSRRHLAVVRHYLKNA